MNHLLPLIFCILALGTGSCDKFNSTKVFVMDANFRSYYQFQNGSTWVYTLQSDTTQKETVTLHGQITGRTSWDGIEQDFLQYDLLSNIDSAYKFRAMANENNTTSAILLVKDTFFKGAAQWYYAANNFAGITGSGDTVLFHNDYLLLGKTYTNVIEIKPKQSAFFKRLLMAKAVGIISKELQSGKNYVLKSYNVK